MLIEFWATWCPACISSHPRLNDFAKKHKEIAVLAVSDEDKKTIDQFLKKHPMDFTNLHDEGGKVSGAYMVPALPSLVVIDREGVVRHVAVGAGRYIEETVAKALSLATVEKKKK